MDSNDPGMRSSAWLLVETEDQHEKLNRMELVGVGGAISNILWSLYFMQEQGCRTTHAILYQDNMSAILLESNG